MDLISGLEYLAVLGVDRYGTLHLLHLFFPVPVGPYSTDRKLFAFIGEIPSEPPPPPLVADIPGEAFHTRRAIGQSNSPCGGGRHLILYAVREGGEAI